VEPERADRQEPTLEHRERTLALSAFAIAAVLLAAIAATPFIGHGLSGIAGVQGGYVPVGDLVVDGCIIAIALVVTTARPTNPIGWLLLAFGGLGAIQNFAEAYGVRAQALPSTHLPLGRLALSLGTSLWIPAFVVPAVFLLNVYPSGRASGRWTRTLNRTAAVATFLAVIAAATSRSNAAGDYRGAHDVVELPGWFGAVVGVPVGLILFGCVVASVVTAIRRTARAVAPERQQLLLLLTSAALLIPLGFLDPVSRAVGLVLVPLAVAVGVLRFRLLGIDVIVRRTLLYALLTGLVIAVYTATTALMSSVTPSVGTRTVVAAALVAVLLVPLRDRLQRAVDRVVYGARRDPLRAVREVGTSMSAASADPLPMVVQALAGSIRASRVAVIGTHGESLASAGTRQGEFSDATVTYPLRVGGEHLADLQVTPAAGDRALAPGDGRVVEALAVPIASIVHAARQTERLRAASARALTATHEERARIRRDLHDGLGPSLSGVALGLEAIEAALPANPPLALTMTARLHTEVQSAVEEIRRIIDALQPGALDRADLLTALRERADAVTARSSGLLVTIDTAEPLPSLPSAVEHAAFRIVDEALNNVVRHAHAANCTVRISADNGLLITVADDGIGIPTQRRQEGVGLLSMQQRAFELGGTVTITGVPDGGTVIEAHLPLADTAVAL
jgi:signal transduction histidine kinase